MVLPGLPTSLVPARHWKEASATVGEIAAGHKGLRASDLPYLGAYNRLEAQHRPPHQAYCLGRHSQHLVGES